MEKTNVNIDTKACTECLCCQLRCSFVYTGAFNLEKARIVIEPIVEGERMRKISFTDECVKDCHLCTLYCATGALTRT